MEKIKVDAVIDSDLNWEWGISLEKLKGDIERLEKLGTDKIYIDTYEEYGDTYIEIKATQRRLETDEEFEIRKEITLRNEKQREEREKEMFIKLQAKYDK